MREREKEKVKVESKVVGEEHWGHSVVQLILF